MIDYTAFREGIELYLDTNFSTVPIQFENTTLKDRSPFIYIIDQNASSDIMGMGETVFDVKGFIIVQIFSILGTGTGLAKTIASELSVLFKNHNMEDVSLGTPVLASFGPVDGAEYYQHNLTIPYQYFYGQG